MSNFSTIYDQLLDTTLPGLTGFSTKTKIANPYQLVNNDEGNLRDGYGLIIGDSSDTDFQEICNSTTVTQIFGVVLTRVLITTHHNATPLETLTKNIVEDAVTIRKDFLNPDQIDIPSAVQKIDFISRTGLEFLGDEFSFITTTVFFSFDIKDSL